MYIIFICAALIFIYLGFFYKNDNDTSLKDFHVNSNVNSTLDVKDNKKQSIFNHKFINKHRHSIKVILSPRILTKFIFFNVFFFVIVNFTMQVIGLNNYILSIVTTFIICSMLIFSLVNKEHRSIFTDDFITFIQSIEMAISGGKDILTASLEISEQKDNYTYNIIHKMCQNIRRGVNIDRAIEVSVRDLPYIEFTFYTIVMKGTIINGNDAIPLIKRIYQLLITAKKLNGKINSMVSEPKGGAKVVGAVPVFFGLILYFLAPEAIDYIKNYPLGHIVYGYSIISIMIGFFIVNKMIDIASEG